MLWSKQEINHFNEMKLELLRAIGNQAADCLSSRVAHEFEGEALEAWNKLSLREKGELNAKYHLWNGDPEYAEISDYPLIGPGFILSFLLSTMKYSNSKADEPGSAPDQNLAVAQIAKFIQAKQAEISARFWGLRTHVNLEFKAANTGMTILVFCRVELKNGDTAQITQTTTVPDLTHLNAEWLETTINQAADQLWFHVSANK